MLGTSENECRETGVKCRVLKDEGLSLDTRPSTLVPYGNDALTLLDQGPIDAVGSSG